MEPGREVRVRSDRIDSTQQNRDAPSSTGGLSTREPCMSRHRLVPFLRLLSVLSIAAPAALFAFFAWHSYEAAIQTANDRASRFSAIVREHALKVFETVTLTLERVDHRIQDMDWEQIASSQAL